MGLGTQGQSQKEICGPKSHWTHSWNQNCTPPLSQLFPNPKGIPSPEVFNISAWNFHQRLQFRWWVVQNHLSLASTKHLVLKHWLTSVRTHEHSEGITWRVFSDGRFPVQQVINQSAGGRWGVIAFASLWFDFFLPLLNWVFLACAFPILSPLLLGEASNWGLSCWLGSTHHSKGYLIS